ncbi:hypothetical protein SVIO_031190 [Streptomyces violaceusniger]|uniref:ABC transmembrane type-1 domain-containing protein n=1 Tax=Streptomyces violaceusniger TaxID=68280 RepID=A0A4D4L010_STRVO|nr:hypothetical protein SVIO_031190 [Streptomyces violaceusniger]
MSLTSDPPVGKAAASGTEREDYSALKVVPVRHPWRWAAVVATAVLVAQFAHGLMTNPGWEWDVFADFFTTRTILKAVWITIQLTFYGTALGFALGIVLAFMRLSQSPFLKSVAFTYIWAFRSIPLIVQLLFWFNLTYLYKRLDFGIPFGPGFFSFDTAGLVGAMSAAVLGLALHQAAYAAEIVRGGVLAVDGGQLEAAAALGIPGCGSCAGSCSRRRCARSCPTPPTRSSRSSRAPRSSPSWRSASSSTRCRSSTAATAGSCRC